MPVSTAPTSAAVSIEPASWTYASGLASALEGRLLTLGATRDLLATPRLDELVSRIRQTLLFAEMEESASPFALAESMDACLADFVAGIRDACPSPAVAELFQRPLEWRAFRAYLRVQALEREPQAIPGARVPEEQWQQCWSGSDVEPQFQRFAAAASHVEAAMPREERDQRLVDEITFTYECRDLTELAEQTHSAWIREWVTTWLTLRLALALRRCRLNGWGHVRTADALDDFGVSRQDITALVSPEHQDWRRVFVALGLRELETAGSTTPPPAIERMIDDAVTARVQAARGVPFGPEPVFAFLWAARTEALNLRIVAAGRGAGIEPDIIAEDLRQTYA